MSYSEKVNLDLSGDSLDIVPGGGATRNVGVVGASQALVDALAAKVGGGGGGLLVVAHDDTLKGNGGDVALGLSDATKAAITGAQTAAENANANANGRAPSSHVGATGAAHGVATKTVAGFISPASQTKLDGIEAGAEVNAVTSVAGRKGAVTLTAADVGALASNATAAAATKLATARTIGGVSFDGTANINLPGVNAAGNQNTTGNAATATKLATARTFRTNLASTATASFDGSANIAPGVTGVLPVANGGTGLSAAPALLVNLESAAAASPLAAAPRPGVTGVLPVARGGSPVCVAASVAASGALNASSYGVASVVKEDVGTYAITWKKTLNAPVVLVSPQGTSATSTTTAKVQVIDSTSYRVRIFSTSATGATTPVDTQFHICVMTRVIPE